MNDPITWGQLILCDIGAVLLIIVVGVVAKWIKEHRE